MRWCGGIPIIVSAGEDGAVTHVPSARLLGREAWAGTLTFGRGGLPGEARKPGWSTQSWEVACTSAATLTHTGKLQGNDQIGKKQVAYVREAVTETGSTISWYQAQKRKIQRSSMPLFSLKFVKMSVY